MKIFPFVFMILSLLGCHQKNHFQKAGALEKGVAIIAPTAKDSKVNGTVTFEETSDGLKLHAILHGLPPGKHGFHVHEFGALGNEGNDAGGHYNPVQTKHGYILPDGFKKAHAGDLGNIEADDQGNAELSLFIPGLFLNGEKYSVAGRTIIIHEKPDDFGQPTGNAGSRIGGGIITIIK